MFLSNVLTLIHIQQRQSIAHLQEITYMPPPGHLPFRTFRPEMRIPIGMSPDTLGDISKITSAAPKPRVLQSPPLKAKIAAIKDPKSD
jgi:hypothetical protein